MPDHEAFEFKQLALAELRQGIVDAQESVAGQQQALPQQALPEPQEH